MSPSTDLTLSRWPSSSAVPSGPGHVRSVRPSVESCHAHRRAQARTRRNHTGIGLLVAIGVHSVFLLAFNSPPSPRQQGSDAPIISEQALPLDFALPPEELPPSVAEDIEEAPPQDSIDGPVAASLPEPISTAAVADITLVIRPSIPVMKSTETIRWSVPASQVRTVAPRNLTQVFKLSDLDRRPVLVSSVEPIFPTELTTSSVEGVVVVRFIVNARGAIEAAEVVSAPHPVLGTAVTKSLARWQFRAGVKNGRAVSTEMELPVRFNLAGT